MAKVKVKHRKALRDFRENAKQARYRKRKSIIYANTRFDSFGFDYNFVVTIIALTMAMNEYNQDYKTELTAKHCITLLLIKNYLTVTNNSMFTANELKVFYPDIDKLLGFAAIHGKKFQGLIRELMDVHFINPHGDNYIPTVRLKHFCTVFDRHCKTLMQAQS